MSKSMEVGECGALEYWDRGRRIVCPLTIPTDFIVGRDQETCAFHLIDPTVSNQHLRIYCIDFQDEKEQDVAPMVYAENLSRKGTVIQRQEDILDPGMQLSTIRLHEHDRPILLNHGDGLHVSDAVSLRYLSPSPHKVPLFADDSIRALEMKQFEHSYTISRRRIGRGAYGEVHLAFDKKSGAQLACKVIDLQAMRQKHPHLKGRGSEDPDTALEREIEILSRLSHPNFVALEHVFYSQSTAYIFTELVTAGDLLSYVDHRGGQLDDVGTAVIIRQILLAVKYLHDKQIVHRDLKPENILMTSLTEGARVVVTDFGHARYLPEQKSTATTKVSRMFSVVGTVDYGAPEIYRAKTERGYSKAVDMWSIGIITGVLLSGSQVFSAPEEMDIADLHRNRAVIEKASRCNLDMIELSEGWKRVGKRAKDFVRKLLVLDEVHRLTADEALNHPWFANQFHKDAFASLYERAIKEWQPKLNGGSVIEQLEEIAGFESQEAVVGVREHEFHMPATSPESCRIFKDRGREDHTGKQYA